MATCGGGAIPSRRFTSVFNRLGLYRQRGAGRCGLCGQDRVMTEAHVPPQSCGNSGEVRERAQWVSDVGGARLGPYKPGGVSVYGLCRDCNALTSDKADPAYIDFHRRVSSVLGENVQLLLVEPGQLPVRVAPGLVARSVLAGMFAINDRLQDHFPDVARGLREKSDDLRLSDDLQLRLALTTGRKSRIGGPVGYMRVLGQRAFYMPLADIWFPPLAWCLRSVKSAEASLGVELTAAWGDVSDWIRYGPDLVTDLRNVTRTLPVAQPPQFGADEWMLLTGDETMTALEGRPRR